jgi:hypothetical protein
MGTKCSQFSVDITRQQLTYVLLPPFVYHVSVEKNMNFSFNWTSARHMYNYPEPFFFRGYSQPYGVSLSFISLFSLCFPSVLLSVFFLLFKIDCRFLLPSLQKRKNKAGLPKRKLHRTRKGTQDARKRGGSNELGTKPRHTWAHKQKENEWVKTKEKWRKAIKRTKARPTLFFSARSPSPDVQYFT